MLRGLVVALAIASACGREHAAAAVHAAAPAPTANAAADVHVGSDASVEESAEMPRASGLAADRVASGSVRVTHARYVLTLPDEHVESSSRALQIDDDAVHTIATLGERLWTPAGLRIEGRAGLADFAVVSPEGTRYAVRSPDEIARWFLALGAPQPARVSYRRTDETVVAMRRDLSLVLFGDRSGPPRPVACRFFVALLLGGDPGAARVACARATLPTRVTLRADGWLALQFDRRSTRDDEQPAASLTVPPSGARFDATYDAVVEPSGAFDTAEPGANTGALETTNGFDRAAFVFVDDTAVGWLRAGATASFEGLARGRHHARARTIDGTQRSRLLDATIPGQLTFENSPLLRR
jgi:hypothetical protein